MSHGTCNQIRPLFNDGRAFVCCYPHRPSLMIMRSRVTNAFHIKNKKLYLDFETFHSITGTSLVLYDGSPLHPHNASMWDLVDECGITIFGTSAKWIAVQEDRMVKPRLTHNLSTLKAICSTGSPLKPHSFDYVYRDIKANILLASISGGTDIIGCFMGENSTLPVFRGEIQSASLGCAIECWDSELEVPVAPDVPGELVCTKPFPSMPVRFWNDDDFKLYQAAYFDKIPGT